VLFDYTGSNSHRWRRVFPYTRTALIGIVLAVAGFAMAVPLVVTYVANDFALGSADTIENHLALTGLAAVICGAQLFVFAAVLHGTMIATTRARPNANKRR
jgi:hypothetical protein